MALCRQNYQGESEAGVNKLINMNQYAGYVYQSMAYHFDDELKGFYKFFKESSTEKREHACKLMKFQNIRGGRILLQDVKKPDRDEWGDGLNAMKVALALEKNVNQAWVDLRKTADKHGDPEMTNWIETEFLHQEVAFIKTISDHIANLKRAGPGLGEYTFDQETLQ